MRTRKRVAALEAEVASLRRELERLAPLTLRLEILSRRLDEEMMERERLQDYEAVRRAMTPPEFRR